jgi:hypothetical protein
MNPQETLSRLIDLSQTLGCPEWDCAVLGE